MERSDIWTRLALVGNGGLAAAFVCIWSANLVRGDFWRADFQSFYLGARMVVAGDGPHLYDLTLQKEYQDRLVPERAANGEGLLAFVNPPHFAALMLPLATLTRAHAFLAWALLQLALLGLLIRGFLQHSRDRTREERLLIIVTLLAFPPLFLTFQLGQLALVGVLAWSGFYIALERNNSGAAGFWLAVATLKPQLAVVPAIILLARRDWSAITWSVLVFGIWAVLATSLCGWRIWQEFLGVVAHNARQFGTFGIYPERMYNLKGLLTGLLGGVRADLINALTTAAFVAGVWAVYLVWRGPRVPIELAAALSFLLGLIVNPHFNPADALCLALPGVLFLLHLHRAERPRTVWAFFLLASPLLFAIDNFALAGWSVRPYFLVMLVALAAIGREYLHAARTIAALDLPEGKG